MILTSPRGEALAEAWRRQAVQQRHVDIQRLWKRHNGGQQIGSPFGGFVPIPAVCVRQSATLFTNEPQDYFGNDWDVETDPTQPRSVLNTYPTLRYQTYGLAARNFGFNLPDNAPLVSVHVEITCRATVADTARDRVTALPFGGWDSNAFASGNPQFWGTEEGVRAWDIPAGYLTSSPTLAQQINAGLIVSLTVSNTTNSTPRLVCWLDVFDVSVTICYVSLA